MPKNFKTEVIWKRTSAHSDARQGRSQHGRVHDVILFYAKGEQWMWNTLYTPYDEEYVKSFYRHVEDGTGRRYRLGDITGPGGAAKGNPQYEVMGVTRYWRYSRKRMQQLIEEGRVVQTAPGRVPSYKRYLDEMPGVSLQDIWADIPPIGAQARERLSYPTQKPVALMERILESSSNEGDVVLDPFCGCGTTVAAAQKLSRRWIGIDITHLAINLIRHRLVDTYGPEIGDEFETIGEPVSVGGARELASSDPYQFQWWALGKVGARPAKEQKGADRGIDGRLFFHEGRKTADTKGDHPVGQGWQDGPGPRAGFPGRRGPGEGRHQGPDLNADADPEDARGSRHSGLLRVSVGETPTAPAIDNRAAA